MSEPGYQIHRTSLGECVVVLDMGAVDRHPEVLALFPVFTLDEYREILPAMMADERKAAWDRRVAVRFGSAARSAASAAHAATRGSARREAAA